ncbi:MAG: thiazole synthase [Rhodothermales bacterium]
METQLEQIPEEILSDDVLQIGSYTVRSRLLVGSSRFPNPQVLTESLVASGTEMVTVAIRRVNLGDPAGNAFVAMLRKGDYHLLPNTAGCYTAREAILVAELAREALETDLIKLEVIGDNETLYPDVEQLLNAARTLVVDGFTVLAYANDDPVTCRKLADIGCAAVMPLAAPIGSGAGILNKYTLRLIREHVPDCPLIVDAGIGTASDAAVAMELGYDGVLVNTAIAEAQHPVEMAHAMRKAVEAGRHAWNAGRVPTRDMAKASTPFEGKVSAGS